MRFGNVKPTTYTKPEKRSARSKIHWMKSRNVEYDDEEIFYAIELAAEGFMAGYETDGV